MGFFIDKQGRVRKTGISKATSAQTTGNGQRHRIHCRLGEAAISKE